MMQLIETSITIAELKDMANKTFGNLVKAVIDLGSDIMMVDAELHADEEWALLENGSSQEDLWGINLYPEFNPDDERFIEFDSMINLRPSQENRSRGVEDPIVRERITGVVRKLVSA